MNTRERLKSYGRLLAEKKALEIELSELEGTELQAVSYDNIGTSYGTSNRTQDLALKNTELQNKYKKLIKEKTVEISKIENAMSVLKDKEREFITLKYIEDNSWEFVSYKIDRGITTCKRINREALTKIEQILSFKI